MGAAIRERLPPPEAPFIELAPGQCTVIVADDIFYMRKKIRDPLTKRIKTVTALVLHVVQQDGRTVDKYFSFVSYKAQQTLYALYTKGVLLGRPVRVCRYGEGFLTEYTFELL